MLFVMVFVDLYGKDHTQFRELSTLKMNSRCAHFPIHIHLISGSGLLLDLNLFLHHLVCQLASGNEMWDVVYMTVVHGKV